MYSILERQGVHLWVVPICDSPNIVKNCRKYLTFCELKRANQFVFSKDHNRFIVARGVLRMLLAKYTDRDARQLEIQYMTYGKPYLKTLNKNRLTFNLSHSGDYVVYVFSTIDHVGIDIEKRINIRDENQLVVSAFTDIERKQIKKNYGHDYNLGVLQYWTAKEAYTKAIGLGLNYPLHNFSISFDEGEAGTVLDKIEHFNSKWRVYRFIPHEDYIGALVTNKKIVNPICFEWDWS